MTYRETCILLPCHSLEDFPMHLTGEDADGVLAAWSALWHPCLLASTGAGPVWHRGENPPTDLAGCLLLGPGISVGEIPADFADRARAEGARVILGNHSRPRILAEAIEPLADQAAALDPDLVADFLALGFCYLQVELLTRQMRYSTNLDEIQFYEAAVSGAKAAVAGDADRAREQLHACFDLLAQERDHYYAVDAYLLDLTLLTPRAIGPALEAQLRVEVPTNLFVTASLLEEMERRAPTCLEALRQGVRRGFIGLIGGDPEGQHIPFAGCETMLSRFQAELTQFQTILQAKPSVYGRRTFGLSAFHPQLLHRLGFVGAFHTTYGEGQLPESSQMKFRWEGVDRSSIDTIGRMPLNASKAESFLGFANKLGETMDMDHVAAVCLAHWPGQVCTWYHDLRRIARYGSMLGKLVTVDDFFRDTDYPGQSERFQADQYHSPYLQQAVTNQETNPISRSVRYWRQRVMGDTAQSLETLATLVSNRSSSRTAPTLDEIDRAADSPSAPDLEPALHDAVEAAARRMADCIPRGPEAAAPGYLVLNPSSFVRRVGLDLAQLETAPTVARPIYASASDGDHKYTVVDVPQMGFAWVQAGVPEKPSARPPHLLAEPNQLRNEFFEAGIDPATGALQSILAYEQRGNRLSQQLAVRLPRRVHGQKRDPAEYSTMVADRVDVTAATTVMGEITSEGRLLNQGGDVLATFLQRFQLWRGSRVLRLHIELDPIADLGPDPWKSYYACRFAWATEGVDLWRGVHQMRERAEAERLEAPNYVEIDEGDRRTAILTGGLPFHRRSDLRMLDSLLIVHGEDARSFDVGIGIDVKYPMQEAIGLLAPTPTIHEVAAPPQGNSASWLLHVDSRNVLATSWFPICINGLTAGFRVRLLETAGRSARTTLKCFRSIGSAERVDFHGKNIGTCPLQDGAAKIEMGANEWTEIRIKW